MGMKHFNKYMDQNTLKLITTNATSIAEYAALSLKLKAIAKTLVGPSRTELLAIAQSLEHFPRPLFRLPLERAFHIVRDQNKTDGQLASELNTSVIIVKQTKAALIAGGVKIEKQRKYPERSRSNIIKSFKPNQNSKGPESTNEDRSNEERIEESIALVEQAVKNLSETTNWDSLNVRQKIKLLKEETLKIRGTTISSQTLYRPWVRDLW